MNLSKIMASRYRSRFSILFCIWVWHIKGVWHIILTVLIFLSYKNSKYGSCHINPGERRNFSFYLGNTGSAQVKFSCFSKICWGLVWLIRLHLNATVNLPSCRKTSKFSPQTLGEARSCCVQCLGSGAAPCDRGTCCSWVSWDPSLPLPGLGGPRQGRAGPPLSLHKMSSCALAPSVWAAGWGQGGSLHSRNGVGGPICPTQLCAAGAQQVYMHRTGGAVGLFWSQNVRSGSSWAGFTQGAAVLWGLGVGSSSAPFLYMEAALFASACLPKWEFKVLLGASEKEMLSVNDRKV